jgi:hypothetical protein
LFAATSPDAKGGRLYSPGGLGNLSGVPTEQAAYSRLRSEDEAVRIWRISEDLTGASYPIALSTSHPKGDR